jgi:hypothetical protein
LLLPELSTPELGDPELSVKAPPALELSTPELEDPESVELVKFELSDPELLRFVARIPPKMHKRATMPKIVLPPVDTRKPEEASLGEPTAEKARDMNISGDPEKE